MNRLTAALAIFSLAAVAGYTVYPKDAPPGLMDQAYQLGLQYHWAEAQPLVKQYLLWHPGDASAHFLLGRSYLHQNRPYILAAEGEFNLALRLYEENGQTGALTKFLTPPQFEASIYRELGRLEMRLIYEAERAGLPEPQIQSHIEKALGYVRKGLALDPNSDVLSDMEKTLKEYQKPQPAPAPPPSIRRDLTV